MQIYKVASIIRLYVPAVAFAIVAGLSFKLERRFHDTRPLVASHTTAQATPKLELLNIRSLRQRALAARNGDVEAGLEIARRYSLGQGVARSEAQAFAQYRLIADRYSDIDPTEKRAGHVAEAFRLLAQSYRKGVPDAKVAPDPAYAVRLLSYAASYFRDPSSQFELAKLILKGEGAVRNPRNAAQWLLNASRKGYVPAQALLGRLLWDGDGVQVARGDGLGLMAVARRNASPDVREWVEDLFDKAASEATATDLLEANAFVAREAGAFGWALTDDILVRRPNTKAGGIEVFKPVMQHASISRPVWLPLFRERLRFRQAQQTISARLSSEMPGAAVAQALPAKTSESTQTGQGASTKGAFASKATPISFVPQRRD